MRSYSGCLLLGPALLFLEVQNTSGQFARQEGGRHSLGQRTPIVRLDDILDAVASLLLCFDHVFKAMNDVAAECGVFSFELD